MSKIVLSPPRVIHPDPDPDLSKLSLSSKPQESGGTSQRSHNDQEENGGRLPGRAAGDGRKESNAGGDAQESSGASNFTTAASPLTPILQQKDVFACRPLIATTLRLRDLYRRIIGERCVARRERMLAETGQRYRDKEGHYITISGEEIFSRYIVSDILGKGSFGVVVKCWDLKRREVAAMKITRQGADFRNQAKLEVDVLIKLNDIKALDHLVVKVLKVFDWQGHLCLVFEPLSFNLYQLIKCTNYTGVSIPLVRKFAYQLLQVLSALETHNPPILHCDLKPENILLKNQNRSGIRVIDFGSACYNNKKCFKYIQSRFYRAPEVILRLDYGTAIDRWSLGCVLVEMHTGLPIFPGKTESSQISGFEGVLGAIPDKMLDISPKTGTYYRRVDTDNGGDAPVKARKYQLLNAPTPEQQRTIHDIIGTYIGGPKRRRAGQEGHEIGVYELFVDFISKLLTFDPDERMSCKDALAHPFLEPIATAETAAAMLQMKK